MTYQYGGSPPYGSAERPPCWSQSYEDGSRECRVCGFQTTCKDAIIQRNAGRLPQAPQYYRPTQPYSTPQPVVQPPPYQPRPVAPIQQYPHQYLQQVKPNIPYPPSDPYAYGWLADPLYYQLPTPPPMRPQMGGETFIHRVVKNTGLAMIEALFGQCLLAVRQMVCPPTQEAKNLPPTPENKQLPPK